MDAFVPTAATQQVQANLGRESVRKSHPRTFRIDILGTIAPATLTTKSVDNGGTRVDIDGEIFLLAYPYFVGPGRRLLLVELGDLMRSPKHPLWANVQGVSILAKRNDRALVQVKEGQTFTVFTSEGTVSMYKFHDIAPSDKAFRFSLSAMEAFKCRFQVVEMWLNEAEEMSDLICKAKLEDRALHELAAMIGMTKRFPELRGQIIGFVCKRGRKLRTNVFNHFGITCADVGDMDAWRNIHGFQKMMEERTGSNVTESTRTPPPARKGPPAAALAKKAKRRERDREAYENKAHANPKRSNDSNNGKGKKGGKNNKK